MRRRQAELCCELVCAPVASAHCLRQAELHRGIGERRGVVGFDLRPQTVFAVLLRAHVASPRFACVGLDNNLSPVPQPQLS
jgi:hypothetical protein